MTRMLVHDDREAERDGEACSQAHGAFLERVAGGIKELSRVVDELVPDRPDPRDQVGVVDSDQLPGERKDARAGPLQGSACVTRRPSRRRLLPVVAAAGPFVVTGPARRGRRHCASASRTSRSQSRNASVTSTRSPRGRSKVTSITVAIVPGAWVMTTTWSDSSTASETEWLTNSTVVRVECHSWRSSRRNTSLVSSSRAENGSSMSKRAGSETKARAIATRCRIPPDSSAGRRSRTSPRPKARSTSLGSRGRFPSARCAGAVELERKSGVVEHSAPRQQGQRLGDEADELGLAGLLDALAEDRNGPLVRPLDTRQDP